MSRILLLSSPQETKDGHYTYRAEPPYAELHPVPWSSATAVAEWLQGLLSNNIAEGTSEPMDWQAAGDYNCNCIAVMLMAPAYHGVGTHSEVTEFSTPSGGVWSNQAMEAQADCIDTP